MTYKYETFSISLHLRPIRDVHVMYFVFYKESIHNHFHEVLLANYK